MHNISYVIESPVHGLHSEWDSRGMYLAHEVLHNLNEELFNEVVYRPLCVEEFVITHEEEMLLNAEYARQMYVLTPCEEHSL
jgi:hypothetical protein